VTGQDGRATTPRVARFGEQTWLIQFDAGLDAAVNEQVIALAAAIQAQHLPGVVDVVPAASSLAVHVDAEMFQPAGLEETVAAVVRAPAPGGPRSRVLEIPVCYEKPFSLDLDSVASACRCGADDVVLRHQAVEYRVFMLGFLPGFPYLGPVDDRIAVPRRPVPRVAVPAGSVGIAGRQTGVYPMESPGGWQIIGRTPMALFDAAATPPARLRAGDRVRFVSIGRQEFARLEEARDRREP
jgi:inhibitor of KinA